MSAFLRLDPAGADAEQGGPDPSRLLSGDPRFTTWNLEERDGLYAGIWESTPGAWRVVYEEWEFCHILVGHSILTEDGHPPVTLRAGDSFVLRPGFTGIWEVIETMRKSYVVKV